MLNSTFPVNGGALPKIDRQMVMRLAWKVFRETYHYPHIKFASIGRPCFAWALRKAWHEAKAARTVALIPADVRANRIDQLRWQIERARFGSDWFRAQKTIIACDQEIMALSRASEVSP